MPDHVLRVIADTSPCPIAVLDSGGRLVLANRALRLLVDDDVLDLRLRRVQLEPGRRVILPTRAGGALALEAVPNEDQAGTWVLRGEEPVHRGGLAEQAPGFRLENAPAHRLARGEEFREVSVLVTSARRAGLFAQWLSDILSPLQEGGTRSASASV